MHTTRRRESALSTRRSTTHQNDPCMIVRYGFRLSVLTLVLVFVYLLMAYIKDQMDIIKTSIASAQKTKTEMEQILEQMTDVLSKKSLDPSQFVHAANRVHAQKNSECDPDGLIRERIQEALDKYDADKTGLVDFALQSAGGSIWSIGQTDVLNRGMTIKFLGWKICTFGERGPETILQPAVNLGNCWAFKGTFGSVVVRLFTVILIDGVSLEHVSSAVAPRKTLTSAPREFSVFALVHDSENQEKLNSKFLGRYNYSLNSTSVQYFPIEDSHVPLQLVEIRFHNNHGNENYTCVYRVRIHGTPYVNELA